MVGWETTSSVGKGNASSVVTGLALKVAQGAVEDEEASEGVAVALLALALIGAFDGAPEVSEAEAEVLERATAERETPTPVGTADWAGMVDVAIGSTSPVSDVEGEGPGVYSSGPGITCFSTGSAASSSVYSSVPTTPSGSSVPFPVISMLMHEG